MKYFYIILYLFFYISTYSFARTIEGVYVSAEHELSSSDGVFEVEVQSVILNKESNNKYFSYLYKARIKRVFKGDLKSGDIIVIGIIYSGIVIFPTQKQLVVLGNSPFNFFDYKMGFKSKTEVEKFFEHKKPLKLQTQVDNFVEYREPFKSKYQIENIVNITDIKIPSSLRIGFYELLLDNKNMIFKGISCQMPSIPVERQLLLFDKDYNLNGKFRQYKNREGMVCTEMVGKYSDLKKLLITSLNKLQK